MAENAIIDPKKRLTITWKTGTGTRVTGMCIDKVFYESFGIGKTLSVYVLTITYLE